MNANEAKRLSDQSERLQKYYAKKENEKLELDREAARERARKDSEGVLKEIYDKITKVVGESRKISQWLEYESERVGRAYLTELIATVKTRLEKEGYKISMVNYDSYAKVFDGSLMNPEVIGQEYSRDTALMYVEW